ncbi:GerAB/ArcD/ProY family transporter [Paenibacillus tengchongensis]|uniref:GerAB/ArcD/ProY family transporter n=1 Tax=Paenibacillus tengchongensis TaxID=2608684 RepID=UPI00124C2540|nr:GerAB/ArcD/ProY family transporter [Paenibacillus tengchongensis]
MAGKIPDRITTSQAVFILVNYILVASVFTLPRTAAEKAGTPDIWISVICGGVLSVLPAFLIACMCRKFPGETFFQFAPKMIGKPLALATGTLFCLYFLCYAAFELRSVQEITVFFLLEGTPNWAVAALFIWVALYLCRGGINALSRMCRLITPLAWTIFFGVCLLSLKIFDISNLRPVLGEGLAPVFRGMSVLPLSYTAGEALLFLVAFMDKPKQAGRVAVLGTLITIPFYVTSAVLTIGAFSVEGTVTRTWPFIDLIRSFEVALLFERFESLLLAIWTMQIFSTFCIALYGAALGISQMSNLKLNHCLFAVLPLVYLLTECPPGINSVFAFGHFIGDWAVLMFGGLSLPLLLLSAFRRKKT